MEPRDNSKVNHEPLSRDEKISSLYNEGHTVSSIMKSVSCSRDTVYKALKRSGLTTDRLHRFTDNEINTICYLFFNKRPMTHIRDVTGFTKQQVWYVLDRYFISWSKTNDVEQEAIDLLALVKARRLT